MWYLVKLALSWLVRNGTARVYTSRVPVGSYIGGKDAPEIPDLYIILDVRVKSRILILGYFQTS